jgi:arsenate reductase
MKEIGVDDSWEIQNIKENHIDEETLEAMVAQEGSYEAVFSKRSLKYKMHKIAEKVTQDSDYKPLILNEYTFLKRPVVQLDDTFYIGNSKKVVASVIDALK